MHSKFIPHRQRVPLLAPIQGSTALTRRASHDVGPLGQRPLGGLGVGAPHTQGGADAGHREELGEEAQVVVGLLRQLAGGLQDEGQGPPRLIGARLRWGAGHLPGDQALPDAAAEQEALVARGRGKPPGLRAKVGRQLGVLQRDGREQGRCQVLQGVEWVSWRGDERGSGHVHGGAEIPDAAEHMT